MCRKIFEEFPQNVEFDVFAHNRNCSLSLHLIHHGVLFRIPPVRRPKEELIDFQDLMLKVTHLMHSLATQMCKNPRKVWRNSKLNQHSLIVSLA